MKLINLSLHNSLIYEPNLEIFDAFFMFLQEENNAITLNFFFLSHLIIYNINLLFYMHKPQQV